MMAFMKDTLKTQEAFREARKGKRYHSQHFLAFFTSTDSRSLTVVTPKAVGNAVTRNRVRRVTRETLRTSRGTLLLHAKATAGSVASEALRQDLQHLLQKVSKRGCTCHLLHV